MAPRGRPRARFERLAPLSQPVLPPPLAISLDCADACAVWLVPMSLSAMVFSQIVVAEALFDLALGYEVAPM